MFNLYLFKIVCHVENNMSHQCHCMTEKKTCWKFPRTLTKTSSYTEASKHLRKRKATATPEGEPAITWEKQSQRLNSQFRERGFRSFYVNRKLQIWFLAGRERKENMQEFHLSIISHCFMSFLFFLYLFFNNNLDIIR